MNEKRYLTEQDVAVLRQLVAQQKSLPINARNRPAIDIEASPQAPGVYAAVAPSGGIPALSGVQPGIAQCAIYRYNPNTLNLEAASRSLVTVGNLATEAIAEGAWVVVTRDNYGTWWAVGPGAGEESNPTGPSQSGIGGVQLYLDGPPTWSISENGDEPVTISVNISALNDPYNNETGPNSPNLFGLVSAVFIIQYDPTIFVPVPYGPASVGFDPVTGLAFNQSSSYANVGNIVGLFPGSLSGNVLGSGWYLAVDTRTIGFISILMTGSGTAVPLVNGAGGILCLFYLQPLEEVDSTDIGLEADFNGGNPITFVSDQNFYNYILQPPPQDTWPTPQPGIDWTLAITE